jgi:type II secretion system protein L
MTGTPHTLFIRIRESRPLSTAGNEVPAIPVFMAQSLWLDAQGQGAVAHDAFIPLPALLAQLDLETVTHAKVVVLLPAVRVFLTTVSMSKKQSAQLLKIPAYAIEDQLVEPIESLRIVAGKPATVDPESVRCSIAAVNQVWLQALDTQLNAYGIRPVLVTSEASLIAPREGAIDMLLEPQQVLLASNEISTALEYTSVVAFLEIIAAKKDEKTARVTTLNAYCPQPASTAEIEAIESLTGFTMAHPAYDFKTHTLYVSPLQWLADRWFSHAAPAQIANLAPPLRTTLLTGDKKKLLLRMSGVLALWIVIQSIVYMAIGMYLNSRAESVYQSAVNDYRKIFPHAATVSHQQVRDYIASRQSNTADSLIVFLNTLASQLASEPEAAPHFTYVQYQSSTKMLEMRISASDFSNFEHYRQQLHAAGIEATADSLTREANTVKGTLHVTLP